MITLGISFGHDASVTVLENDEIRAYVYQERVDRIKHSATLKLATVDLALSSAGLNVSDIDTIAVTSSQGIELVVDEPSRISVNYSKSSRVGEVSRLNQYLLNSGFSGRLWRELYPDYRNYLTKKSSAIMPYLIFRGSSEIYEETRLFDQQLAAISRTPLSVEDYFQSLTVVLDGRQIPGYFIDHHLCHAASAFSASSGEAAMIFTHDGTGMNLGFLNGGYYLAKQDLDRLSIEPLMPHKLTVGKLYHQTGTALGLGLMGSPGKLMGLAAYGKPIFFESGFIGNAADHRQLGFDSRAWLNHCLSKAKSLGYQMDGKLDGSISESFVNPLVADIAASTQKLFEEVILSAVTNLTKIVNAITPTIRTICLSGGAALNCPTNSRIVRAFQDYKVVSEPACDDGGLSHGAAAFVFQNFSRSRGRANKSRFSPFQGCIHSNGNKIVKETIHELNLKNLFIVEDNADSSLKKAALLLSQNKFVGWYEGKSEMGPRALGHRSILADARKQENWTYVNRLKKREWWRPFAPIILEKRVHEYFSFAYEALNRYMLGNAKVNTSLIPAATHVDGTARVQTISADSGKIYDLLWEFSKITNVPILLNTSFNGPGEPIVETPADALKFLSASDSIDFCYLFIDGILVKRSDKR